MFYNATRGPNWRDNTSWLSDRPIHTWHGITTDVNGRVTGLELSGKELRGEVPVELGDLFELERLQLGGSRLTGCVPVSLRNVPYNDFDLLGLPFC